MKHLPIRRLAATGAGLALAATGMAISAAPAHAASAELNYTCDVSGNLFGSDTVLQEDVALTAVHAVSGSVAVGGSAEVSTSVEVPEEVVGLLYSTGQARTISGSAVAQATAAEAPLPVDLAIPKTAVPASGGLTVVATGTVPLPASLPVGTSLPVSAGDFSVKLDGKTADGGASVASPYTIDCTLDAEQNAAIGTVNVVKAKSKTKVTAKGKKKKAVIQVKVKSETSVKATGKVKVTLKGPKKVTKNVKVNKKGVAKVTIKKLKKGKYKVNAKYAGDKNVEASKGKLKGKVKVK